jgi:glycosyltransferase involved in cell wall biosynthesis
MVATSPTTRGGISSVLKVYQQCDFWKDYNIKWVVTHTDGSLFKKMYYALKSFFSFIFIAPRYNLVHIHLSEVPSMLRKLPFFLISRLYHKKIVIHFHSYDPGTTINSRFKPFYRFMFSKADRVIVLSSSWKNWLKDSLRISDTLVVLYNPCMDVEAIMPEARQNIILFAGALTVRKGYADLIRAFGGIASQAIDWKLVFAGSGEIEKGKKLAEELGISNQIEFAGWVNGTDKAKLFASARIFCLPSYAEGFPMAILDAYSYGIPVITTPVGGIPDIIKDKVNGLLFTPGDIQSLSNCLLQLITHPKERNALRQESYRMAKTIFNPKEIEKQLCALYDELLSR